jgi:hypothetical protein
MKTVYYKSSKTNEAYGMALIVEDMEYIDMLLDAFNQECITIITEDEFDEINSVPKFTDVMNKGKTVKIGRLATKKIQVKGNIIYHYEER